ncbi:MAG: peptidoglycan editing factor PgeF [Bacilli bacterium]|jgi:YfiH family protein
MIKLVRWPRFVKQVDAFTTTREGGVSKEEFTSLNLSFTVGDRIEDVSENRARLFREFNLDKENTVIVKQFHSDITKIVTKKDASKGYEGFLSGVEADALLTTDKNLALGIYHADCVPVFLYVPTINLVGICHAGSTGTLKFITQKCIKKIKEEYKVKPEAIYAYIGPSLHFSNNEISKEQADEYLALGLDKYGVIKVIDGKYLFDVPLFNFMQLREEGIPTTNIDISEFCTFENEELFYSYRRNKKTGRMMSFIRLR